MQSTVGLAAIAFTILALSGPALGQESGWREEDSVVHLREDTDNVGIGTDTPGDNKLKIAGISPTVNGILITSSPANYTAHTQLIAGQSTTDRAFRFINHAYGGNRFFYLTHNLSYDGTDWTQGNWGGSNIIRFINGEMNFYADPQDVGGSQTVITPTKRMTILSSGNVGIGTSSPKNKLDVEGSAVIGASYSGTNTAPANGLLVQGNVGIGTASPGYRLDVDGTIRIQNGWRGLKIEGSGSDPHRYDFIVGDLGGSPSNSGSFGIYDDTESAYRFAISKTGNVGIGTMNAGSYKLAVKGQIRAEEVVVETGWSDFVFEAGYNLMPLPDVERYIAKHQHLPDIPSAEEVAADGLSLGETQALLLQKIEELTLYVIDLKKENKALNMRIETLEIN